MDDSFTRDTRPVAPSWKQILMLLAAGAVLIPGLCSGVISNMGDSDGVVLFAIALAFLSVITLVAALAGTVIRLVRVARRR